MGARSLALLAGCAIALASCATPSPPTWAPLSAAQFEHPLTLAECADLAAKNGVRAAQWQARIDAAAAELTGAKTLPNPSFALSWEDLGIRDASGAALDNLAYGLSYPIFFWVARGKQVAAAKRRIEAEQYSVQADRRQLEIEIGTDYFNLLGDIRKERASAALLDEARENLRLVEESLKLGSVSGHDLDLSKAEALQAELDLFDARRDTQAHRLAFAFALGADRPVRIDVADAALRMPDEFTVGSWELTADVAMPDALLAPAIDADPLYAAARSIRLAAEAQFQVEVRKRIPFTDAHAGGAVKHDPDGTGNNVSLEVPIPIFDWNQAAVKRARADLLAAQAHEEEARRTAAASLAENWQAYGAAWTRYENYATQIAQARERLAADARELFTAGQISYIELVQARSEWRKAELTAADAWRGAMTSAWELLCRAAIPDRASLAVPYASAERRKESPNAQP